MRMKLSKWHIDKVSRRSIDFLGYRISASYKLLRKDSVKNAKRKIERYRNSGEMEKLRHFLASWLGHASWADSYNLVKSLKLEVEK